MKPKKQNIKTNDNKDQKIETNAVSQTTQESLKNEEAEKYKDLYLRTLADYKNLENRVISERQNMKVLFQKDIILKFLPFLDNLEQASIFNSDQGLKMIRDSFLKTLESVGLSEISLLGTKYDPETAEVLAVVDGENEDEIVEIIQKAYSLNGQIIRHGKVKVCKKNN